MKEVKRKQQENPIKFAFIEHSFDIYFFSVSSDKT